MYIPKPGPPCDNKIPYSPSPWTFDVNMSKKIKHENRRLNTGAVKQVPEKRNTKKCA